MGRYTDSSAVGKRFRHREGSLTAVNRTLRHSEGSLTAVQVEESIRHWAGRLTAPQVERGARTEQQLLGGGKPQVSYDVYRHLLCSTG